MRIPPALSIAAALACAGFTAPVALAQDEAAQEAAAQAQYEAETAERVAAVQRHVDAYRSGNLDRFVATFAPDAEVYATGIVARGHAEIRELYRLNFVPGAPRIKIHQSDVSGELVYLSIGYVFADGNEVCCSLSEYAVRDGRISYLAASG